jgi:hypothetical protein
MPLERLKTKSALTEQYNPGCFCLGTTTSSITTNSIMLSVVYAECRNAECCDTFPSTSKLPKNTFQLNFIFIAPL